MTEVTFLVWPLSVATICSSFLSNTTTFLSAPPGGTRDGLCKNPFLKNVACQKYIYQKRTGTGWNQCTSENFAGVWGTQIQSQNTRNTGTMKTLKATTGVHVTTTYIYSFKTVSAFLIQKGTNWKDRNQVLRHVRPLGGICWDPQL